MLALSMHPLLLASLVATVAASSSVGCWRANGQPIETLATIEEPEPRVRGTSVAHRASPRCASTVDHVLELAGPELDKIPSMKERLDLIRQAVLESCESQEWPEDTLACFATSGDLADLQLCQARLSTEQSTDLNERMADVLNQPLP